jgi:hypothetical protein
MCFTSALYFYLLCKWLGFVWKECIDTSRKLLIIAR